MNNIYWYNHMFNQNIFLRVTLLALFQRGQMHTKEMYTKNPLKTPVAVNCYKIYSSYLSAFCLAKFVFISHILVPVSFVATFFSQYLSDVFGCMPSLRSHRVL